MKKIFKWIAITFAALIVSCAALALIGGNAPRNASMPTAQPAVVAPTSAPATTAVLQAAPTAAPAPTATPDTSVAEYGRTMVEHSTSINQALTRIAELSQAPRFSDQAWKVDMAMQFAILRKENAALQQITPPTSMQDVHAEVLAATADFDAMTYRYAKGLDTLDASEINAATKLMTSGSAHIARATALMKAK